MIQFYSKTYVFAEPEKQEIIDNKVKNLQKLFGDRQCTCHPNYQWAASIEWTAANTFTADEVSTETVKPCSFLKDILQNEIRPYLT